MEKVLKQPLTVLILFMILCTVVALPTMATDREESEISEISESIEKAVTSRDFHSAKEFLAELYPLMKEDIKVSKKELAKLKKTDDGEIDIEVLKMELERKIELYDRITHLVEASPAALRARSADLVKMVNEFSELVRTE